MCEKTQTSGEEMDTYALKQLKDRKSTPCWYLYKGRYHICLLNILSPFSINSSLLMVYQYLKKNLEYSDLYLWLVVFNQTFSTNLFSINQPGSMLGKTL